MSEHESTLVNLQAVLKLSGAILLTAVVLVLGLYYAPASLTADLQTLLATWLEMVVIQLPLLVLGSLTAGLLAVFISPATLPSLIPRRWPLQLLLATVMGLIIPFGLFGNVPLARQFRRQGIPASMVLTFLLAAAMLNPLTLLNSWVALGASLTLWRVLTAVSIALVAGLLTHFLFPSPTVTRPHHTAEQTRGAKIWAGLAIGADELILFGALFIVGSLLTVVITTFLPLDLLLNTAVGAVLYGFLTPPQTLFPSDTAVWLSRALPLSTAVGYLTANTLLPLSALFLHTRLWRVARGNT